MKKAFILIGIQACGKSTFCSQQLSDAVYISLDDLHTRNKENLLLTECIANGRDFVVDNTNPTKADRAKYISTAKTAGYKKDTHIEVLSHSISDLQSEVLWRFY